MHKFLTATIFSFIFSTSVAFAGYEGLISNEDPLLDDNNAATQNDAAEPLGYQGLISGAAPSRGVSAPKTPAPTAQTENQNPPPAIRPQSTPLNAAQNNQTPQNPATTTDLSTMALARQGLADKQALLETTVKMSPKTISLLEKPQIRIGGMLPVEFGVAQQIETLNLQLNAPNLPADEKEKRLLNARKTLEEMLFIYEYQANMPPDVMRKMGLSDLYITENTEAHKNAVQRIKAALASLQGV